PSAKIFVEDERAERPTSLVIHRPDGLWDLLKSNLSASTYPIGESRCFIHFSGRINTISYQILITSNYYPVWGFERMAFFNGELCNHRCSHVKAVFDAI